MVKQLMDKEGTIYGWNFEMAKLTDLYTEVDSADAPRIQQYLRQPKRTMSVVELAALEATGNPMGHYPSEPEVTVVVPPAGLQTEAAVARRRLSSQTIQLQPDDEEEAVTGPPMHVQMPRPEPLQAQDVEPVRPSGPQRGTLRRRSE